MIKFNEKEFTQNQAAKVLLKAALDVAKDNMSEEFKSHAGLDLDLLTAREARALHESISKWCSRLSKSLNINFDYSIPAETTEEEDEIEYFQLKSGGFAAKGYYSE